jgi:putative salt-induced outer membrane protein YdiY
MSMKHRSTRIPYAWLLAAALTPTAGLADQLVMKNGDIITGEITAIAGDKVTIQPAYSDAFAVNMADVASIEADSVYDVVMADGREVQAQFAGAADGQQNLIVDQQPMAVALPQITMAAPPPPYSERVSHVDLNMTLRDGNTDSRNTLLFADTRMRFGVHRHIADLTFAREEVDGIDTKKQDLLRYEYNWLLDGPWYLGGSASYESDPIKELDHRYTVGVLVGRDFFNDNIKLLTASLGAGYSEEELAGISDSGAVGLWKLVYQHKLRQGALAFFHNHNIDYHFYGDNNAIFKSNTGFRWDVIGSVYTSVSLRYDYETEPAPGAESYDTTLAVGIGAEF